MIPILSTYLTDFLIGTLLFTFIFEGIRPFIHKLIWRQYYGWTVEVTPTDDERRPYNSNLLAEEVERFLNSELECRRFVQSVCSSENFRLKAGLLHYDQPNNWVYINKDHKRFSINLSKADEEVGFTPQSNAKS